MGDPWIAAAGDLDLFVPADPIWPELAYATGLAVSLQPMADADRVKECPLFPLRSDPTGIPNRL